MALSAQTIEQWCNDTLSVNEFKDYCPNGLQVDAANPIAKMVTGVTASQALIERAIDENAQAILVHHGYFWKGESQTLTGMKGKRIRLLMQHGISLLAYHLPLDAHPSLGNNVALAEALGLTITAPLFPNDKHSVGNIAISQTQMNTSLLTEKITHALNKAPLVISQQQKTYQNIGICTGGAQDFIEQAHQMGCDAYISGEISERTTHSARELGIDYFACGHHATEKGGVKRLGKAVAKHFDIPVSFIDIDNPA